MSFTEILLFLLKWELAIILSIGITVGIPLAIIGYLADIEKRAKEAFKNKTGI